MVHINEKIIEKIDKSECDEVIKKFLKIVLSWELEHFEYGRWMFSNKYRSAIEKFVDDLKVK